jgi:hypothetical protein
VIIWILKEHKGREGNNSTKAYFSFVCCRLEWASSWDSLRSPVFPSKHAINLALQWHSKHQSIFTIQVKDNCRHNYLTIAPTYESRFGAKY